jgi:hypothetical protein
MYLVVPEEFRNSISWLGWLKIRERQTASVMHECMDTITIAQHFMGIRQMRNRCDTTPANDISPRLHTGFRGSLRNGAL